MRPAYLARVLSLELESVTQGHHTPTMLWGAPGVGKSQLIKHIADKHQVRLIDIRLSQMEPSDLRGIPFRRDDQVEWAVPQMLPHAELHGERGILFLDEITSAPPSVSAAAYQLILDRKLGEYQVPDGWAIFAAGNRQGDRGVSYVMPAPLANRFSHFEFDLNLDDWVKWAFDNSIDERIIAFLRFRPDLLFNFDAEKNPTTFPTPRSWEFADRALKKFESQPDVLGATVEACVGSAASLEVCAFIKSIDRLPDLQSILRGEKPPVPKELDLQYALACALVGQAIKAQSDTKNSSQIHQHILEYAQGFPQKEMAVMMVSDMHRAIGQALFETEGFAPWASSVVDLMFHKE